MAQQFDLENGFLVVRGAEGINRWQTGAECILTRIDRQNRKQTAWLPHECRAESVSPNIFGDSGNFEFVAVKGWNENIFLRSGSYNYGFNSANDFLDKAPEATYETGLLKIQVHCKPRTIRELSFNEALALFQEENDNISTKVHILVEYERKSYKSSLHAPCRFTNYPSPHTDEKYLQPISGQVLFEDDEKIFVSYLAAHMREDGIKSV